jgi:hypothetical protein
VDQSDSVMICPAVRLAVYGPGVSECATAPRLEDNAYTKAPPQMSTAAITITTTIRLSYARRRFSSL